MSEKRQQEFDALMGRISSHLTPEQQEQIRGVFTASPNAAYALAEETMAKSDYTRNIQEVNAQRQELSSQQAAVAELSQKVSDYDTYMQQNYLPRADYEKVLAERNQFQATLDGLKAANPDVDFSMFENTPNGGQQQMNNQQQPQNHQQLPVPPVNPIRNITEPQFQQFAQQTVALAALAPATQIDIANRHQALFGTPITDLRGLVNEAMTTGRDLQELWAEKYNVSAKEAEIQKQVIENEIESRVNAEVAKRVSQGIISGAAGVIADQHRSPFLQGLNVPLEQRQGVTGAPNLDRIANQGSGRGEAAMRATEAYTSGKYANEKFSLIS